MAGKLTQKIVREYVRRLGGTFKKTDFDDYCVRLAGCEYFTDALDDVLGTARAMCGTHENIDAAEQYLKDAGI